MAEIYSILRVSTVARLEIRKIEIINVNLRVFECSVNQ